MNIHFLKKKSITGLEIRYNVSNYRYTSVLFIINSLLNLYLFHYLNLYFDTNVTIDYSYIEELKRSVC